MLTVCQTKSKHRLLRLLTLVEHYLWVYFYFSSNRRSLSSLVLLFFVCVCLCCSLFCCCPTKRALINKFVWLPTRTHRIGNPRDLWIMGQNHQEDTLCNYLSLCAKQSAMFSNNKHGWIMACAI